jgi:CRP-like cAMP-binding protein
MAQQPPGLTAIDSKHSVGNMTTPSSSRKEFRNALLRRLPQEDIDLLLGDAAQVQLPVGAVVARKGDAVSAAFFPESGLIAMVRDMESGNSVAIGTVGAEGVFGLGSLFDVPRYAHRMSVVVESRGYQVPPDRLHDAFERSDRLRRILLSHFALRITEFLVAIACQRVHSQRQRLARWLLEATDKSGERSLSLTHDAIADMVGGPRHAVTKALNELRRKGGLAYLRGRIDILERSVVVAEACPCYQNREPTARP